MKRHRHFLLFSPLLLLTGCVIDVHYCFRTQLYNYSGHGITAIVTRDNDFTPFCVDGEFPEVFFTIYDGEEVKMTHTATEWILEDNEKMEIVWFPGYPEEYFKELGRDTLTVYFFHADTLRAHPWEEIREKKQILARYDITRTEMYNLRSNGGLFYIYYPPTPEMKEIRMWPSYDEILSQCEIKTFTPIRPKP